MTAAQASIRQLYEQVRVLEAEAARPARRRRRLPLLLVLTAAAAVGAASAGVAHEATRRAPVHLGATVAHLIDAPADRARPVHVAASKPAHVARRVPAPVRVEAPRPVAHATAPVVVHAAVRVVHARPAAVVHVVPASSPTAAPAVQHPTVPRTVAPRPHPKASVVPVGIGPVVVATSDEPQPDTPGATTATTP